MRLELYDHSGIKISDLSDDSRPLGFFSPPDGYRLLIVDLDPSSLTSGGWLEDTSHVQKYTISDEAYNKLGGKSRKFREKLAASGSVTSGKKGNLRWGVSNKKFDFGVGVFKSDLDFFLQMKDLRRRRRRRRR
ncbi:tubulin-folding cofactor B-like isoform X3 [Wolffia australiana]